MKKLITICLIVVVLAAICVLPFGREAQAIPRANARNAYYRIPQYISKTATAYDDDLFDVDGGAIKIVSFLGIVTTSITETANSIEITFDADSGWTDYDFSTSVETSADSAGTRYTFTNVKESVLTPMEGADGGASDLMSGGGWFCGEGMIEQNVAESGTAGAIKWYMLYVPLDEDVTVTAQ